MAEDKHILIKVAELEETVKRLKRVLASTVADNTSLEIEIARLKQKKQCKTQ